jgi:hypothetical protein
MANVIVNQLGYTYNCNFKYKSAAITVYNSNTQELIGIWVIKKRHPKIK